MKDLDKLTSLLKEFGVGFSIEYKNSCACVILQEGQEKITGYHGFTSHYLFDESGKFVEIKIWE